MSNVLTVIQNILSGLFVPVISLLSRVSPGFGLFFISAVAGILLVYLYSFISNQSGIRKVKQNIHARLLEAIVFRHDLRLSLKAQGKMFLLGFKYLFLALPPLLILLVPCVFVMSQLNLFYGTRPLRLGENGIVEVEFNEPGNVKAFKVRNSGGIKSTDPVRILSENKAVIRISPEGSGGELVLETDKNKSVPFVVFGGNEAVLKPIPQRISESALSIFLYPGGDSKLLSQSGIKEIRMSYPEKSYLIFGLQIHWMIIFFVVSLISGLIFSRIFKIEV